jgi:hypothetical protein
VETAQAKITTDVAISGDAEGSLDNGDDEDKHEEVFTLGRMNTRSQTQVN